MSSVIILGVLAGIYLLRDTYVLNIALGVFAACAVYELFHSTKYNEAKLLLIPSLAYALLMSLIAHPMIITFVYVVYIFIWIIAAYGKSDLPHAVFLGCMSVIIAYSLSTVVLLRDFPAFRFTLPMVLFASLSDVYCYVVGMTLGRHKLSPHISPKKTVEGAVGGVLLTAATFVIYALIINNLVEMQFNLIAIALFGIVFSALCQMGDLVASVIKRYYGIKDFGNLIPGHGGVYDRIDSWIFAAPFILFFVSFIDKSGVI